MYERCPVRYIDEVPWPLVNFRAFWLGTYLIGDWISKAIMSYEHRFTDAGNRFCNSVQIKFDNCSYFDFRNITLSLESR